MNYLLIGMILLAVGLHIAEYFCKKGKRLLAGVNLAFHALSLIASVVAPLELWDVFVFLLCSGLAALFLKYKEEEHGI